MSAIQKAIRDAVKGGWKQKKALEMTFTWGNQTYFDSPFLDPAFWTALGKARGWGSFYDDEGMPRNYNTQGWYPRTTTTDSGKDGMMWQAHWHSFIDALANGKTAEQFFADLK